MADEAGLQIFAIEHDARAAGTRRSLRAAAGGAVGARRGEGQAGGGKFRAHAAFVAENPRRDCFRRRITGDEGGPVDTCQVLNGKGRPCMHPTMLARWSDNTGRRCPRIEPFACNLAIIDCTHELMAAGDTSAAADDAWDDFTAGLGRDTRRAFRRRVSIYRSELEHLLAARQRREARSCKPGQPSTGPPPRRRR